MKPLRKEKPQVDRSTDYPTLIFKPLPGVQFPDLDCVFLVNGEPWGDFMGSFDGIEWRVILKDVPKGATLDIRTASGEQIKFRKVKEDEKPKEANQG